MTNKIIGTLKGESPIARLVFLRLAFGVLMLLSLIRFYSKGWIEDLYINPDFVFSYYGLEWIGRPGAEMVYLLFSVAVISTILITIGLFYRWAMGAFILSFFFLETIDLSLYLNHYYFISLFAILLFILPAHHAFSVDALRKKKSVSHVQRWCIIAPLTLIGGLYFMAGIAKLNVEWLLNAMPMKIWLPPHSELPLIGWIMDESWAAYLFSWSGAIYDLSIPLLLLYSRSRKWTYLSVVIFHGLTALLFPIGMFPYVMMSLSIAFFPLTRFQKRIENSRQKISFPPARLTMPRMITLGALLFLVFIFPFRHLVYPGELIWHEQGYRFSWRVMLMEKAGHCFFYVKDPEQKGEVLIDNRLYLTAGQEKQMSYQPDLILQFAHHLEKEYQRKGISDPEVRVESWVSLNGEGSRLLIDPLVDLSEIDDGWKDKEWIIPYEKVMGFSELRTLKASMR